MYQFTKDDFNTIEGEIIVYIKAFDDMFSTSVVKRTSYVFNEVIYGAKFKHMFSRNSDDTKTILHVDLLNDFEKVIF